MNAEILYHAFLIRTQQVIEEKKKQNQTPEFFVAELVGSHDWPYPFSTIYHGYYSAARSLYVNWNTARTMAGKLYLDFVPRIERELGVKLDTFVTSREASPP